MRKRAFFAAAAALAASAAPLLASEQGETGRVERFASLPYWDGYWVSLQQFGTTIGGIAPQTIAARETGGSVSSDFMALSGYHAPWNEEGLARMEERQQTTPGRKAMGWGFPMMMDSAAPLQFLITPEEVLIVNPYGDIRHIYTDGRDFPPAEDLWPTVWGTSIGHWEGDTLVIETRSVKNPNAYFHAAPPLSDNASYSERIRMNDRQELEVDVTIVDPTTLSEPWKVHLAYERDTGFDRMIHQDYENDRTGFDGEVNTIEPLAGSE